MERLKYTSCITYPENSITGATSETCTYTYEKYDINADIQDIGLGIINFIVLVFFWLLPYIILILVMRKISKTNTINKLKSGGQEQKQK